MPRYACLTKHRNGRKNDLTNRDDTRPIQVKGPLGNESNTDYDQRRTESDAAPEQPAYLQASMHLIATQQGGIIRRVELRILTALR